MELMIMVDACKRASARQTAVIPYFGYARADRKTSGRESITAKLTANLLEKSGVDRVLLWICIRHKYKDILIFHVIIFTDPCLIDYLETLNLKKLLLSLLMLEELQEQGHLQNK